eukprot:1999756-Ditylum_brightwellii.AAC.1
MESYQTKELVLTAEYYQAQEAMQTSIEMEMDDPIAFAAKHDSYTMYLHQLVKQPDAPQFVEVIIKEINGHIERGHWQLIPIEDVPNGSKILDDVLAMKLKRDIKTSQDNQVQIQAKCA